VTSPAAGAAGAPDLPEYAPVPAIAKGAALNEHGYHVWQVERNLYAVTDNVYMSAFLTTPDGVVILASVNPGPIFKHYGENVWAAVKAHLDAVTEHAAAPVIAKYTGVLGGADIEIFTRTTTFAIMQSIRLDRGPSGPVHP